MTTASHAALRRQGHRDHTAKLRHLAGGGASDRAADRAMIAAAIEQHEAHDHKGQSKTPLKLKAGGAVAGSVAKPRLDRPGRARGGKTKSAKGAHVNVIVAGQQPHPMPVPVPAGGPPLAAHPPLAPPGPAMPPTLPPGGAPALPPHPMPGPPVGAGVPGMRARGGRAGFAKGGAIGEGKKIAAQNMEENHGTVSKEPGAGSGLGRIEKIAAYGKKPVGEGGRAA